MLVCAIPWVVGCRLGQQWVLQGFSVAELLQVRRVLWCCRDLEGRKVCIHSAPSTTWVPESLVAYHLLSSFYLLCSKCEIW